MSSQQVYTFRVWVGDGEEGLTNLLRLASKYIHSGCGLVTGRRTYKPVASSQQVYTFMVWVGDGVEGLTNLLRVASKYIHSGFGLVTG